MIMKKSNRIQKIVEISGRQTKTAIKRLGLKIERRQAELEKLEQLMAYRDDYSKKHSSGESMRASQISHYRTFLEKMNEAIEQQKSVVDSCDREINEAKSKYLACHRKENSYEKLKRKVVAGEQRIASKREQSEADDRRHKTREH